MDTDYTSDQARQDVIDFVTDTTDRLPVDSWESLAGTPFPGICDETSDNETVYYSYSLSGKIPPASDIHIDAQKIADYWETLGMNTRLVEHGNSPTVYATDGPLVRATFSTDAAGGSNYDVEAVSKCAPGDFMELYPLENERAERREVIPGDAYFLKNPPESEGTKETH